MKVSIVRALLVVSMLATALGGLGCATSDTKPGEVQAMACCRCECKMMTPDPANPAKCQHCGHSAQDHNVSTNAPSATHQH